MHERSVIELKNLKVNVFQYLVIATIERTDRNQLATDRRQPPHVEVAFARAADGPFRRRSLFDQNAIVEQTFKSGSKVVPGGSTP